MDKNDTLCQGRSYCTVYTLFQNIQNFRAGYKLKKKKKFRVDSGYRYYKILEMDTS